MKSQTYCKPIYIANQGEAQVFPENYGARRNTRVPSGFFRLIDLAFTGIAIKRGGDAGANGGVMALSSSPSPKKGHGCA
jgi:hypothetical protein